ncbi:uncharacterized protein [Panulirus ornatus]|uniref:uncharacterized protein n=1 Tax=Panulirus ornatus TaxID=150431 RepID=UPI003A8A313F
MGDDSGRSSKMLSPRNNFSIDQEPYIKTEPAIILEELTSMGDSAYMYCENDDDPNDSVQDGSMEKNQVIDMSQEDEQSTICHICSKTYKNKSSLSTHLRVKHNLSAQSRAKMPCLEPGCDFRGNRIARLISHLIRAHKMKFQCEKVTFQQKDDFWKWKKEAEERCRASYSAQTSAKTMVSGDLKFFLRCRRSGFVKSTDSKSAISRPRFVKKGSMKINAVCTSFMEVMFMKEGGATVHFCRTHYGHDEDGSHLRMNDEERDMIKDLILEGFPAAKIIAIMKTRMPIHRHQLLKYANIRNISVRQNLFMTRGKGLVGGSRRVFLRKIPKCLLVRSEGDSNMSLRVDNEIEVEADLAEADHSYPTLIVQTHSQRSMVFSENMENVKQLRNEIQAKIERISRLASGLVTDTALRNLSENLDNVARTVENEKHIEVIPEVPETTNINQQNIVLHRDTDGNSVILLCSNRNIDDLVDEKNVSIEVKKSHLNVFTK